MIRFDHIAMNGSKHIEEKDNNFLLKFIPFFPINDNAYRPYLICFDK